MSCPFCNEKEVGTRLIYKDDLVMALPTNIPIVPGHVLVCPARCVKKIDDLSDEELAAIRKFILRLKETLKKCFGAEGFNIAWNEGEVAGQAVSHLHIHVVPRKSGDTGIYEYEPRKFLYRPGSRETSPDIEFQAVAKLIGDNL